MSAPVAVGLGLGRCRPELWEDLTVLADHLGYESVWVPEHLVFPVGMSGSPHAGADTPPVPSTTPAFDASTLLAHLAARTTRVRLGTSVYLAALRHPFTVARSFATLDVVSGGRVELGVGAGWLREEYEAVGIDFATRGRRLDETLDVVRRLWTEGVVAHAGEFHTFAPVRFEPKPVQRPHPPIHVGGETAAALRRAASRGDGWIGMRHTPESARVRVGELRAAAEAAGRNPASLYVTVGADAEVPLEAWGPTGVDRIIVSPWRHSGEALDSTRDWAKMRGLQRARPEE
ncbi:MAG: TIGR03619 family F420-dependent LLM class oxidoreductase [Acidimicrobiia bacterium]|nr:TIGR03619 family F420-dependent LLM class oxidoreductase [Acidimicrobiia bacterium]